MIIVFCLLILISLFPFQLRSEHKNYFFLPLIIGDANDVTNDPTCIEPSVDLCIANFLKVEQRKIKCDSVTPCDGIIATLTKKIITKPWIMFMFIIKGKESKIVVTNVILT